MNGNLHASPAVLEGGGDPGGSVSVTHSYKTPSSGSTYRLPPGGNTGGDVGESVVGGVGLGVGNVDGTAVGSLVVGSFDGERVGMLVGCDEGGPVHSQ